MPKRYIAKLDHIVLVSAVHHLLHAVCMYLVKFGFFSFLVEDVDFTLLGDFDSKTNIFFVALNVIDDDIVEGQEFFEMSLMLNGSSFALVNTGPFEITIEDSDSEFEEWHNDQYTHMHTLMLAHSAHC